MDLSWLLCNEPGSQITLKGMASSQSTIVQEIRSDNRYAHSEESRTGADSCCARGLGSGKAGIVACDPWIKTRFEIATQMRVGCAYRLW